MPNSSSPVATLCAVDPAPEAQIPVRSSCGFQAASREAFAPLVAQHHEAIYNFLLGMTRSPHDAEDLTQETFLKAWKAFARFDQRSSFSSWLFTIARRTAYNHFRSRRPVLDPADAPEPTDHSDPSSILSRREAGSDLWRLARTLKPNHYEALWLRYGEGFSMAETARIMGVHLLYARVLIHRARRQLARLLQTRPGYLSCAHIQ
jgi:RNA polymerase sigma-70 factor (ECF subfamily)